ncbi:MAG: hypothetical protein WAO98_05965 [Alphaproteobacteria bacterium]
MSVDPKPAQALIVSDPGNTSAALLGWAAQAARFVIETGWQIVNTLQRAAAAGSNIMGQMIGAETQVRVGQGQIDAMSRETMKGAAAETVSRYTMAKKEGDYPGGDLCNIVKLGESSADLNSGAMQLSRSMELTMLNNRPQGTGAISGDLARAMDWGFVDCSPTAEAGQALIEAGCKPSKFGTEFVNADVTSGTLFEQYQFMMPKNIAVDARGNLVLPPMSQIDTREEMQYVAAVSYCNHYPTRRYALPKGTSGQKMTMALSQAYMNNRDNLAQANAANSLCMQAVSRRVAVGSAAGGKSTSLGNIHMSQVKACMYSRNMGWLTDEEYTKCQTEGMSPIQLERRKAYAGSRENALHHDIVQGQQEYDQAYQRADAADVRARQFEINFREENARVLNLLNAQKLPGAGQQFDPTMQPTQP